MPPIVRASATVEGRPGQRAEEEAKDTDKINISARKAINRVDTQSCSGSCRSSASVAAIPHVPSSRTDPRPDNSEAPSAATFGLTNTAGERVWERNGRSQGATCESAVQREASFVLPADAAAQSAALVFDEDAADDRPSSGVGGATWRGAESRSSGAWPGAACVGVGQAHGLRRCHRTRR